MVEGNDKPQSSGEPGRALPQVCDNEHELVLVKDEQRYVFRCAPGEERALMDQLSRMVHDPDSAVNWFDAAVLSRQLGERMSKRLKSSTKP